MTNDHKTIDLYGLPLFTWVAMNTPIQDGLPIFSEACFTYFVHDDDQMLSKQHNVSVSAEQVLLSLCGFSLGKVLMEQESGHINAIIIHFHPEILKEIYKNTKPPYWEEIATPVSKYIVQMAASNLIQHYIEGIQRLFENRKAVTEDMLVLKLKEIILLLMQTENLPQITQIIRSLFSERTFDFKETVESYLFTPASIEDLANLTNTSVSTFKREFTKIYKTTPYQYIIGRRIEKVASLLKISDDSISSIGYDCGFATPANLTRVFKAKYNTTPSKYRLDFAGK